MFRRSTLLSFHRFTPLLLDVGIVKFWYGPKGYGFVSNGESGQEIFCHNKDCHFSETTGNFRSLREGQPVRYDIARDPKGGLRCVNVTTANGKPLPRGQQQPAFLRDREQYDKRYVFPEPGTKDLRGRIIKIVQRKDQIQKGAAPVEDCTSLITTHGWILPTEGTRTGRVYFHATSLNEQTLQKHNIKYLFDPFYERKSKEKTQREMKVEAEKQEAEKKKLQEALQASNAAKGGWATAAPAVTSSWGTATTAATPTRQQQLQQESKTPKEKSLSELPFHPSIPPVLYGAALRFGDEVIFDVQRVPSHSHRQKIRKLEMKRHMRLIKVISEKVRMEKEGAQMSPEEKERQEKLIEELQQDLAPPKIEMKDQWELAAVNVRIVYRPEDPVILKGKRGVTGKIQTIYTDEKRRGEMAAGVVAWGYIEIDPSFLPSASAANSLSSNSTATSSSSLQQQRGGRGGGRGKKSNEASSSSNQQQQQQQQQSSNNNTPHFAPIYFELTERENVTKANLPVVGMSVCFDVDVEELRIASEVGEHRKQLLREQKKSEGGENIEIPAEESILIKKPFCFNVTW